MRSSSHGGRPKLATIEFRKRARPEADLYRTPQPDGQLRPTTEENGSGLVHKLWWRAVRVEEERGLDGGWMSLIEWVAEAGAEGAGVASGGLRARAGPKANTFWASGGITINSPAGQAGKTRPPSHLNNNRARLASSCSHHIDALLDRPVLASSTSLALGQAEPALRSSAAHLRPSVP